MGFSINSLTPLRVQKSANDFSWYPEHIKITGGFSSVYCCFDRFFLFLTVINSRKVVTSWMTSMPVISGIWNSVISRSIVR